ncbi:hypothetical protein ACFU7Y_27880 [Kitasatospora sp. NPDC057542]|uniref:hypothetical protein n=1 Tax=Kitasatospora sp. NPDC057542 TaxID=3346162 RepID=UPI003698D196
MGMRRKPYWRGLGTPKTLVLFRTPDQWRYAVHFEAPGGFADGFLDRPAPSCDAELAQAALRLKAEEITHRELEVSWQSTDQPDWWTGIITKVGPLPAPDH